MARFRRHHNWNGSVHYENLDNMEARLALLRRVKAGEISLKEAQRQTNKLPLTTRHLPADAELVK